MERPLCRDDRAVPPGRVNGQFQAARAPSGFKGGDRRGALLVKLGLAVVLVQVEAVACAGEDLHFESVRVLDAAPALADTHRYDGPGFGEHGDVVEVPVDGVVGAARVRFAREEVEPAALGQPDDLARHADRLVLRRDEGGGDQFAPVVILGGMRVGVPLLGMVVIHRGDGGDALGVIAPRHRVEVGDQRVAQLHGVAGDAEHLVVKRPRVAFDVGVFGAVEPQDGTEHAELHPARVEFAVFHAADVAADVVAPPAVADVGGVRREIRLEGERIPGDMDVARETDRVAVVAQAAPAGEDEGPLRRVAAEVVEMEVVEEPERVEIFDLGGRPLLPVHPPEVDPLRFEGMVQVFEIRLDVSGIGDVEGNRFPARRIDAHEPGGGFVAGLLRADPFGGMQVEGRLESLAVEELDELLGLGVELFIPGVAGPPLLVPVHVDDADRERHAVRFKVIHQPGEFRLRVGPIAAPPVAQRPPGQKRSTLCHRGRSRRNRGLAFPQTADKPSAAPASAPR